MKRARKKLSPPDRTPAPRASVLGDRSAPLAPEPVFRRWLFRLGALVLIPLLVWTILALTLRALAIGYPTHFFTPVQTTNGRWLEQNNQFGWRFFGARMSRTPSPAWIRPVKTPGTVRLFVFGESAAYGDPQPQFGLPRLLQAFLELRYPGTRFEVINAAMTGINSNVILPIARDCARADGDIWVVYMGNNEVVGPFGAGTVFGPQAPPLPLIRARLALLETRPGQWFDSIFQRLHPAPLEESEWGGMRMFLDHPVPSRAPALQRVYRHFQQNLSDLVQVGHRHGVRLVLSTVAVNLTDCPPFGSTHRTGFSAGDLARWNELVQRGAQAQTTGAFEQALALYDQAAALDDTVAELHFRQARCAQALGRAPEAHRHFVAARDLDTLRFRCDARLNQLVRDAVASQDQPDVLLADAARALSDQDRPGSRGADLFYDHVHLTFAGNYALARVLAPQIQALLPAEVQARAGTNPDWPTLSACAARLGWSTWSEYAALSDMLARQSDPPFTAQLDHEHLLLNLRQELQRLRSATLPAGIHQALERCEKAAGAAPQDPDLQDQLAELREQSGDLTGAARAAEQATRLLPSSNMAWSRLGRIQAKEERLADAADSFRRAVALDAQDVWSMQNLAQALVNLGKVDEAAREFETVLRVKPRFGLAWLGLGQLAEKQGQQAQAKADYQRALANPIERPAERLVLARFCQSRGWWDAAATNYAAALRLTGPDPQLLMEAGQALGRGGHHAEAEARFAEALRLEPQSPEAHFLVGVELGRMGRPEEAVEQFRQTVGLKPDLLEARLNLGIALMKLSRNGEALAEFEEVLRRRPGDPLAAQYAAALRNQGAGQP